MTWPCRVIIPLCQLPKPCCHHYELSPEVWPCLLQGLARPCSRRSPAPDGWPGSPWILYTYLMNEPMREKHCLGCSWTSMFIWIPIDSFTPWIPQKCKDFSSGVPGIITVCFHSWGITSFRTYSGQAVGLRANGQNLWVSASNLWCSLLAGLKYALSWSMWQRKFSFLFYWSKNT